MKVPLLKQELSSFKEHLQSERKDEFLFLWECLNNFKKNWDLEDLDLHSVFKNSFSSKISNRLWSSGSYQPKKIMLEFIDIDKNFVREMFRDLLNEEKDLMMRIGRFVFACNSLLEELESKDRRFNTHFHEDYRMISVYLAFAFPEKYTIYDYRRFNGFMKRVESINEHKQADYDKFCTVNKSIFENFIIADEDLLKIHEERLYDDQFFRGKNMLLNYEMYTLKK